MSDAKYIGLDVHQATISVAVLDPAGKLVMEAILETKAETILQYIRGLRGSLHVTLGEGTCAAWLHEVRSIDVQGRNLCEPWGEGQDIRVVGKGLCGPLYMMKDRKTQAGARS